MGKSKNKDYWDYEGVGRTYEAMDRRDARKKKGARRDPEAEVIDPMLTQYPAQTNRKYM